MASLKMEGVVKWRGLKSQGPLYYHIKRWVSGNTISIQFCGGLKQFKMQYFWALSGEELTFN